jgi:peptidoglycan hydrolase-like protein with peptidoglycan-binding domain
MAAVDAVGRWDWRDGAIILADPFGEERELASEVAAGTPDVRWVQAALALLLGPRLAVDGIMGPQTRSAVRDFQAMRGLVADGVAGPLTAAALREALLSLPSGGAPCADVGRPAEELVGFAFDDARLQPAHLVQIGKLARCAAATHPALVRIVGHTDPVGDDSYNLTLGLHRAEEVTRALKEALDRFRPGATAATHIEVDTRGEAEQIPGSPELNRRVQVFVPLAAPPRPQPGPQPRPRPQKPRARRPRPKPAPRPRAPHRGQTDRTLPPTSLGIDRIDIPRTKLAPGAAWMNLLAANSTFRVVGAYLQFENDVKLKSGKIRPGRHWHDQIASLQAQGWGVGAIYLARSRAFLAKLKPAGATVRGDADAAEAKALAMSAHLRAGSVIWIDNEDPAAVALTPTEHAYYEAFLRRLTRATPDEPAYRPGLYAHQAVAAQLLARRPDLYVWEVEYARNTNQTTLPTRRTPTPADRRFGLDPANPHCVLKSFHGAPPAPMLDWTAWPVWRQWEGNNQAKIPPTAIGRLVPFKNWDFNSSLVPDPANPVGSPRLLALSDTELVRLDDLDPTWDASGAQTALRRGRLRVVPVDGSNAGVDIAPPSSVDPFHAHGPLRVASSGGTVEIFAVTADGQLVSSRRLPKGWSRASFLRSDTNVLRLPFAYDVVARDTSDLFLFFIGQAGRLLGMRRTGTAGWSLPQVAGGTLTPHPFAQVATSARREAIDVVTVDDAGALVWLGWNVGDAFPPTAATPVPGADVLPSGPIAAVSRGPGELVVVTVGKGLRLRRHLLSGLPSGSPNWHTLALGAATDLVSPHAPLSARHSPLDDTIVVLAIGTDGFVYRYMLSTAARSGVLGADTRDRVGGTTTGLPQPNPFGDPAGFVDGSGNGAVAVAGIRPGQTPALVASPASAVWRELPA